MVVQMSGGFSLVIGLPTTSGLVDSDAFRKANRSRGRG